MEREENLQLIWKHGLFTGDTRKTSCGTDFTLISPGDRNLHAGPDFFNARIMLGDLVWAGNVEIHYRASDWNKHGHHLDPAYDNVILHVIQHLDAKICNSKGRPIQSLIIEPSDSLLARVAELKKNACWIPCSRHLENFPAEVLKPWLNTLYDERMAIKTAKISRLLDKHRNDRSQVLYLALASGFGLPINTLPFELLASGIPRPLLLDVRDDLLDLEALFYGQSGILHTVKKNTPYASSLWKRYSKLQKALPGRPLPSHLWKFLRIRPASFPTLRLSQFALLIHKHFPFNEDFIRSLSIAEIEQHLQVSASEYWNTHYTFGGPSPFAIKKLGQQGVHHLLINVFMPFLEATHQADHPHPDLSPERKFFPVLKAESNHIIKNWSKFGVSPCNAFESQGLVQLYKEYCMKKRCFDCQIGRELFRVRVHEE